MGADGASMDDGVVSQGAASIGQAAVAMTEGWTKTKTQVEQLVSQLGKSTMGENFTHAFTPEFDRLSQAAEQTGSALRERSLATFQSVDEYRVADADGAHAMPGHR